MEDGSHCESVALALRMANDAINETPHLKDELGQSIQIFSKSDVTINANHWIPFGCPAYVLDNALQSGKGIFNKWEYRSRVGISIARTERGVGTRSINRISITTIPTITFNSGR
jgi:hypothetical protein